MVGFFARFISINRPPQQQQQAKTTTKTGIGLHTHAQTEKMSVKGETRERETREKILLENNDYSVALGPK